MWTTLIKISIMRITKFLPLLVAALFMFTSCDKEEPVSLISESPTAQAIDHNFDPDLDDGIKTVMIDGQLIEVGKEYPFEGFPTIAKMFNWNGNEKKRLTAPYANLLVEYELIASNPSLGTELEGGKSGSYWSPTWVQLGNAPSYDPYRDIEYVDDIKGLKNFSLTNQGITNSYHKMRYRSYNNDGNIKVHLIKSWDPSAWYMPDSDSYPFHAWNEATEFVVWSEDAVVCPNNSCGHDERAIYWVNHYQL